jgi:hypothetical protein
MGPTHQTVVVEPSMSFAQLPTDSQKQAVIWNLTVFRQILAPTKDQPIGYTWSRDFALER